MTHPVENHKATLHRYVKANMAALLARLQGLGEYDLSRPVTRTGTNLLGPVKHVATTEAEYFGRIFGYPMPWAEPGAEDNADLWLSEGESVQSVLDLHEASAAHSDATIEALPLDAPGVVPWWRSETRSVTLQQLLLHMTMETAHHAGHADIIRELIDGSVGYSPRNPNLPDFDEEHWSKYRDGVERAAHDTAQAAGIG
ncbi:DinB family protein [Psychromicrobium xiongbiense]|uniref:DinB family protein n=1 Tax=Psychromicrobium xiongbiense TaxID=3051184 RepID=UPI0025528B0B|nr:DinB family protein [Psychromicrobium sp. YIM S02556]